MTSKFKLVAIIIMSAAVIARFPAIAADVPAEAWMSIYLGDMKIGYTHVQLDRTGSDAVRGYHFRSSSRISLHILGDDIQQNLSNSLEVDEQFRPIRQVFELKSSRHATVITALFAETEITAEIEADGLETTATIPIPAGARLLGDSHLLPPMKVGETLELNQFDPVRLILDTHHLKALRKETLQTHEGEVEAIVIEGRDSMGETTYWQDGDGRLVKVVAGLLGFRMVRESQESAKSMGEDEGYHPPADLAVMTSPASDVMIPNPREIKRLKIRISGMKDPKMAIEDSRQKVSWADGAAEYEVTAHQESDLSDVSDLSDFSEVSEPSDLPISPYIQADHPEVIAKSKEIVGDEKNAYRAAMLLRDWVHANMRSQSDAGILRSSVDILRAKIGVCRDYAILYTALARAAGIPTRPVAGLMYWDNGFYYHAWAESCVGEWIPIDATLPTHFVDATHIKLSQGDAAMFDLAKAVGVLQVEVLEFE